MFIYVFQQPVLHAFKKPIYFCCTAFVMAWITFCLARIEMMRLVKIVCMALLALQLSACGVLVVGGVVGGVTILADRRTPAVQAIDLGIEIKSLFIF